MSHKINNTISVITGGGSGIGFAIARLFSTENSHTYILDNNSEAGINAEKEITTRVAIALFCSVIFLKKRM